MEDLLKIAIVQSMYDFAIWFPFFEGKLVGMAQWKINLYRVFQITMDSAVTYYVLNEVLHYSFTIHDKQFWCFWILKFGGVCDAFYILWRYVVTNKPYQEKKIYWWWWTFLGGFRTLTESLHYKNFQKGELTLTEFWIQICVALIISYFILLIF